MWPFGRKDSLRQIRLELDTLARDIANLKFRVLDVEDKTQRWMHRTIKRAEREYREVEAEQGAIDRNGARVSGGLDPVSQRIIEQRRPLKRPPEE